MRLILQVRHMPSAAIPRPMGLNAACSGVASIVTHERSLFSNFFEGLQKKGVDRPKSLP